MEFEPKTEKSVENSEETSLKQNEAVPETPPKTLETELKQDVETEAEQPLSASKVNQVLRFRSQGLTYRAIAAETGLSLATVARILKGIPPSGNDAPQGDDDIQSFTAPFLSPSSPSAIPRGHNEPASPLASEDSLVDPAPQNYYLRPGLTSGEWLELSKKDKASLLAMVGELRAQNSSLQASAVMRKGNGDATYHHNGETDSEASFWGELAKTERVERALRIRDRYSTPDKKEYPADVKSILEVFKILQPKQANEYEVYRQGRLDEQKNLETVSRNSETNVNDIKLEELKQNREIDMERLKWEQEKWRTQKDDDAQKWNWVGKLADGPLGEVVKKLGSAGADRVRGQRLPKAIQTVCPSCNGSIYVDESSNQDLCGRCGAVLQRQMPEMPKSQPQEPPVPPEENNSLKQEKETSEVKTIND